MKQVAIPDPALVADAYLRQILQALRANQIALFGLLPDGAAATTAQTQPSQQAAKLPLRSSGNAALQAAAVNFTLPPDSTAADAASISALANANRAAILQLAGEHNNLLGDVATLAAIAKNIQGQQAEIINRLNQGATA
ncbi:hypothetical protein VSS37_03695 [Candidatus Thiothrix sp. Deng01]|uniref:Uncharacterized protein n=1 Tax=Candidatus Thiothrix phosphatis TaxID=3112415 RepID=A0ABU6CVB6_9GAMM|nr:hypothetical protein [Candidatus Thiothrix sp. Deng01]MEB4590074.1 hypothetical protein [Candidatus Thiothrix sp. Deng01]